MKKQLKNIKKQIKIIQIILLTFIILNKSLAEELENSKEESKYKEYEGKIIENIEITGLKNIKIKKILNYIRNKKGKKFEYKKSIVDFNEIYKLNLFEDIKLNAKINKNNKIILKYSLKEFPIIKSIEIEGNSEIEKKEIKKAMILRKEKFYKKSYLKKDQKSIINLYKNKGFKEAKVSIKTEKTEKKNLVKIKIKIEEKKQYYIEKIEIIGTKNLNPDRISEIMTSKESYIFLNHTLKEENIREDKKKIEQYMKNQGYFFGKVKQIYIKRGLVDPQDKRNKKEGFLIIVDIEEGERYKMGNLNIKENKVFKTKSLKNLINIKNQETYNDTKFKLSLQKIKQKYYKIGYIQAEIIPSLIIDEENKILNWEIEIIEGKQVHIRNIKIENNPISRLNPTKRWVIDRELQIWEGEIFQQKKIEKTILKLRNIQIFKSVIPEILPTEYEGIVDLKFKSEEQRSGRILFGIQYGTISGFSLSGEAQKVNFLGTGWKLSGRGQLGNRVIGAGLETSTNWLFPYTPISFRVNLNFSINSRINASSSLKKDFKENNKDESFYYKLKRFEIKPSIGYFIADNLNIFTSYSLSLSKSSDQANFQLTDIETNTYIGESLLNELEDGINGKYFSKLTQTIGISYDARDYFLNPSKGIESVIALSYTGGIYGGDSQWLKFQTANKYYINPFWKLVLSFYASYSTFFRQANGVFSLRNIDRLFFDGHRELRGWKGDNNEGITSNGSKISLVFEPRLPLPGDLLWLVGFLDAGDINSKIPSFPKNLRYYSVGFGFRLQIVTLPIRLYFAKKIDYSITESKKLTVHDGMEFIFTIGGFF